MVIYPFLSAIPSLIDYLCIWALVVVLGAPPLFYPPGDKGSMYP